MAQLQPQLPLPGVCLPFMCTHYGYGINLGQSHPPPDRSLAGSRTSRLGWGPRRWATRVSLFVIARQHVGTNLRGITAWLGLGPRAALAEKGGLRPNSVQAALFLEGMNCWPWPREFAIGHLSRRDSLVVDWFYYTKMGRWICPRKEMGRLGRP